TKDFNGRRVSMLFIDSAGICGPIVQRLLGMGHRNIREINFGAHSPDEKCEFMRSYMWNKLKEWLPKAAIDTGRQLEDHLTAPGYTVTKRSKILLEPKQKIKERMALVNKVVLESRFILNPQSGLETSR